MRGFRNPGRKKGFIKSERKIIVITTGNTAEEKRDHPKREGEIIRREKERSSEEGRRELYETGKYNDSYSTG